MADLALLRDQREVYGPVASTPTAWRRISGEPCGSGLAMELHEALDPLASHLASRPAGRPSSSRAPVSLPPTGRTRLPNGDPRWGGHCPDDLCGRCDAIAHGGADAS